MRASVSDVADLPLKNRIGEFLVRSTPLRARRSMPQPLDSMSETTVTVTISASVCADWPARDPVGELGFKVGQDFIARKVFNIVRESIAVSFDNRASKISGNAETAVIARFFKQLAVRLRFVSYEQFAVSSANIYIYTFAGNNSVNLIDLLGLEKGPWPIYPSEPPGSGEDGKWGDFFKNLWKWFEQENKSEVDKAKKELEDLAKNNPVMTCCVAGSAATCYELEQYFVEDKLDIPEFKIKLSYGFEISGKACVRCPLSKPKVEINTAFSWGFSW